MSVNFKKRIKIYNKFKNNPLNVSYHDFKNSMKVFGFEFSRQRGSHRIYSRQDIPDIINMQPDKKNKSRAKPYQVKDFINIIEEYNLLEND